MNKVTKTYVRFVEKWQNMDAPETNEEVSSREIEGLKIPGSCVKFNFYDQTTVTLDDGRVFESEPHNVSPVYKLWEPPRGSYKP